MPGQWEDLCPDHFFLHMERVVGKFVDSKWSTFDLYFDFVHYVLNSNSLCMCHGYLLILQW